MRICVCSIFAAFIIVLFMKLSKLRLTVFERLPRFVVVIQWTKVFSFFLFYCDLFYLHRSQVCVQIGHRRWKGIAKNWFKLHFSLFRSSGIIFFRLFCFERDDKWLFDRKTFCLSANVIKYIQVFNSLRAFKTSIQTSPNDDDLNAQYLRDDYSAGFDSMKSIHAFSIWIFFVRRFRCFMRLSQIGNRTQHYLNCF